MRHLAVFVLLAAAACGSRNGDDGSAPVYTSIDVQPATTTLTIALGSTATQPYTVIGHAQGFPDTDVTSACVFSVESDFGLFASATMTVQPHGGKTAVVATCADLTGQAQLVVNLTGSITVGTGVPPNADALFGAATAGTDSSRVPAIEYPIDRAVSPRNIPPIETQWSAAGNDLFHVHYSSSYLNVEVYSSTREAMMSVADWEVLASSAAGDKLSMTVEGLSQAAPTTKFTSTPVTITMSRDTIDQTAIYYWASSQGNVMSQTFGKTNAPAVVKGGCTSCHSVSRNGTRVGYSRCYNSDCGQGLYLGFLRYDSAAMTWNETMNADNRAVSGSFTTFAPIGNPYPDDTQALAMVTLNGGTLALYDPDSGAAVPSNLSIATFGGTHSALMPDWAADGNNVVYTAAGPGQWIDLSGGRIATMSYTHTGTTHTFGTPQYITPVTQTLPSGTYINFFFPSFSPDSQLIVYNAARKAWRDSSGAKATGTRLMLTTPTGAWQQDLTDLNGGNTDMDITWAHWAPNISSDYYWVVFSSERDYGHRATAATSPPVCLNAGVTQCKQIWIGAIARNKLTGAIDPSSPPMWLPGQSPTADNISPYWSLPATIN